MTTDQYDFLISDNIVLELQKLVKLEFLYESPLKASFSEIFEPREEIKLDLPVRKNDMDRVDPLEEIKVPIPDKILQCEKFQTENMD